MPPKSHSSSSHVSRSSSSHSSSSRSSFSSSRSYSGSSHSSSSSSWSSSSWGSSSSGRSSPSHHSSSSHSSTPKPSVSKPKVSAPAPEPKPVTKTETTHRPRYNQPFGFPSSFGKPVYHYGRRHDYVYYPVGWTNKITGREYSAGYYDENGERYDTVAFKNGDKYENVTYHCPYCDTDTILNVGDDEVATAKCPNCGGVMMLKSALDEAENADSYRKAEEVAAKVEVQEVKKKNNTLKYVALILGIMLSVFSIRSCQQKQQVQSPVINPPAVIQQNVEQPKTNTDLFGTVLYMVKHEDGSYGLINDPVRDYDKSLIWDSDAESYYDSDSDCYVWYNTDVTPNLWQYWFEGISSNYDSGWMEHEDDGWYIETTDGNWIKLPAVYDENSLWFISGGNQSA